MKINTKSTEETFALGAWLAAHAAEGDIIGLDGDLGAGKTVFAKGFAKGLDITEPITSPTFTIVQEYESGRMPLYHFDAYRVADPEEMYEIGFEDYLYGGGVCLIEWADLVEELLPERTIRIRITKENVQETDTRRIEISGLPETAEAYLQKCPGYVGPSPQASIIVRK